MTAVKIDSKLNTHAENALVPWANSMFSKRDGHWMAVCELAHVERSEPGATEDKEPTVKLRMVHVEVPDGQHADDLRDIQHALYVLRTKGETLDDVEPGDAEDADVLFSRAKDAAAVAADNAHLLRTIKMTADYADRVLSDGRPIDLDELRNALDGIRDRLRQAVEETLSDLTAAV